MSEKRVEGEEDHPSPDNKKSKKGKVRKWTHLCPQREPTEAEAAVPPPCRPLGMMPYRLTLPTAVPTVASWDDAVTGKAIPWIVNYHGQVFDLRPLATKYWCPLELMKLGTGVVDRCLREVILLRAFDHVKMLLIDPKAYIEIPHISSMREQAHRLAHSMQKVDYSWEEKLYRCVKEGKTVWAPQYVPADPETGLPATQDETRRDVWQALGPEVDSSAVAAQDQNVVIEYQQDPSNVPTPGPETGAIPKRPKETGNAGPKHTFPSKEQNWDSQQKQTYFAMALAKFKPDRAPAWAHELRAPAKRAQVNHVELACKVSKAIRLPKQMAENYVNEADYVQEVFDYPDPLLVPLFLRPIPDPGYRDFRKKRVEVPKTEFQMKITALGVALQYHALESANQSKKPAEQRVIQDREALCGAAAELCDVLREVGFLIDEWEDVGLKAIILDRARNLLPLENLVPLTSRYAKDKPVDPTSLSFKPDPAMTSPTVGMCLVELAAPANVKEALAAFGETPQVEPMLTSEAEPRPSDLAAEDYTDVTAEGEKLDYDDSTLPPEEVSDQFEDAEDVVMESPPENVGTPSQGTEEAELEEEIDDDRLLDGDGEAIEDGSDEVDPYVLDRT